MRLIRCIWHWLTCRAVRQAVDQHRIVRRLLAFQRDRLSAADLEEVHGALNELARRLAQAESIPAISDARAHLQRIASSRLAGLDRRLRRELFEILILAAVVVMAVRTFFVQPMTIPTGSMQPTLYGITVENLRRAPETELPGAWGRWFQWLLQGKRYFDLVAEADGALVAVGPVEPVVPWLPPIGGLRKQDFQVGPVRYRLWNPPRELPEVPPWPADRAIFGHARLRPNRLYRTGDPLIRLAVTAGDHVLVDRLSYNFRRPRRGEIVVFRTTGIPGLQEGTHYLKRLVATGGERVRIGNDRHVVIDGRRLDATTPGFESVYTIAGPPRDNEYSGHVNDATAQRARIQAGTTAPRFMDERMEMVVRPRHCLVLGDNTLSSLDGRRWGDFPEDRVVGRYWMVYWPITSRFGWNVR